MYKLHPSFGGQILAKKVWLIHMQIWHFCAYVKYYNLTEYQQLIKSHCAYQRWGLFKHVYFGIKMCRVYDSNIHADNMLVHLGRDRKCVTAAYTAMIGLSTRTENLGHELCVARLLSSRNSFEGLHAKAINICCTDIPN
jgi:hypothetical protein